MVLETFDGIFCDERFLSKRTKEKLCNPNSIDSDGNPIFVARIAWVFMCESWRLENGITITVWDIHMQSKSSPKRKHCEMHVEFILIPSSLEVSIWAEHTHTQALMLHSWLISWICTQEMHRPEHAYCKTFYLHCKTVEIFIHCLSK